MSAEQVIDIRVKFREVMKCYVESETASISQILWNCFCEDFDQHPQCQVHADRAKLSYMWPTNLTPCDYGSLLHDYIARFYNPNDKSQIIDEISFQKNPNVSSANIELMLKRLKSMDQSTIIEDKVFGSIRNALKTHLYSDLGTELLFFYKFVSENQLVPYAIEFDIEDSELHRVGRVNALFRMKMYEYGDDKLMLYDWMRTPYMVPGSLTWMKKTIQLNIYKYILEKYYGKTIVKMVMVVFHRDNDNSTYEEIEIEDVGYDIDDDLMKSVVI